MGIFALFTLLASLLFFVQGVRGVIRGLQSSSWPVVTAEVVSSEIRSQHTGGTETFVPQVYYAYEIGGERVTNRTGTVSLGGSESISWSKANRTLKRYPQGKVVDVCYHPQKNDLSCVASEAGLTIRPLVLIIGSSVFFYYGMTMLKMV